jgi:hypothetical protein
VRVSLTAACDVSRAAVSDGAASLEVLSDASLTPAVDVAAAAERRCAWCRAELSATPGAVLWCGKRCRQTAWRARRQSRLDALWSIPLRLSYCDPPFPGRAYLYRGQPSFAGEVDHVALVASLVDAFDGWALSTSERGLRLVLPLLPPDAHICPWVKPIGHASTERGITNRWEVLIVKPARLRQPASRDFLSAMPARGGDSDLIGRKPIAFCMWLFALLGAAPNDTLDDRFPGSGIVTRCFDEFRRASVARLEQRRSSPA